MIIIGNMILVFGFGFVVGYCMGAKNERIGWKLRANGDTPHSVDGKFYYIETEKHKYPERSGRRMLNTR